MDNVTHALAGLLLAELTQELRQARDGAPSSATYRRAAAVVGIVAAELPDADLLYAGSVTGGGRLAYLLHHRGHTHTVAAALLGALLVWAVALLLRRSLRAPSERGWLLALSVAGTLSHVALDYTNNYGVHPFWPLSNAWHYGDAVFIVEPWLFVAAIPPLLLAARHVGARVALGLLLAGLLGAAWSVDMVERGVALALTSGAVVWLALVLVARTARPAALGVAAWLAVEAMFFAASRSGRAEVAGADRAVAPGASLAGIALTPSVGNPLCFTALVVERDGETYRVSSAAVAPWPRVRSVRACASGSARGMMSPSARPASATVRWEQEWSAPRAELAALRRGNCVAAAALRFMRVPGWSRGADGGIRLTDLRFGGGGGGFAEVDVPARPAECPRSVPPWTPPRAALLGPSK